MHDYWPSYTSNFEAFWRHEWIKHGVHAILPRINRNAMPPCIGSHRYHYNTIVYFRTTIELYHLLSVNAVLSKCSLSNKIKDGYCKHIESLINSIYSMNVVTIHRLNRTIEVRICLHICPCRQMVFIRSIAN
ncbi:hypothetical protein BDF22DRAFT_677508, partial [Syncephalis plumigaleata]